MTALGIAALITAGVLMLWPIHANGVSGNAMQPHYRQFSLEADQPLPAHPTRADFVRLGLTWPHDIVNDRRAWAAITAGSGFALICLAMAATAASRRAR